MVEDDPLFCETLEDFLTIQGYSPIPAFSVQEALDIAFRQRFDLMLLDLHLPDGNGIDLLKQLREHGEETPALFLTSDQNREKKLEGFGVGADDYITKPVDFDELSCRITAVLQRYFRGNGQIDLGEGFLFDPKRKSLLNDGVAVHINPKALTLLGLLIRNRGMTVTFEQIYDTLYAASEMHSDGAIRVYISQINRIFGKGRIRNIKGIGYILDV